MKIFKVLPAVLLLLGLSTSPAFSQLWSGTLSPARATNWSLAGVSGGIPSNRTQCVTTQCNTVVANAGSSTNTQINAAIQSAPAGTYISLPIGTYNIGTGGGPGCGNTNGIQMCGKSNITLRGAGADKTFLVFTNDSNCHGAFAVICIDSSDTNWGGGPSNTANWTAGYASGTTIITLDSHTNLRVGITPLILDQADDTTDPGITTPFVCQTTGLPCSLEGNNNNGQRNGRDQVQIVRVVGCGATIVGDLCTSNTITISPAIRMGNWSSGKSPGAWWATSSVSGVGIENLAIDVTGDTGPRGIEIFNCVDCWVRGVSSNDTGKAHVECQNSTGITVRDNYFYLTQNSVSQSYGAAAFNCSDMLVENDIMQFVASPFMINGSCTGCVYGYNYAINDYFTNAGAQGYVSPANNVHTAGTDMILFEGNIGPGIYGDNFHGTGNIITYNRNYWGGNSPACWNGTAFTFAACTSNQVVADVRAYHRFFNFTGNVMGWSGVSASYQNGSKPIWDLGGGNTEGAVTVPTDSQVAATLFRWGNYDVIRAQASWCGSSSNTNWVSNCGSTSEVPSGIGALANIIPATETVPNSYYYTSTPSWWPVGKAWPPIGPDVTGGNFALCSGGTYPRGQATSGSQCVGGSLVSANLGGHVNSNPAMDCYLTVMGGTPDGTGAIKTFNADACYSTAAAPQTTPAPATGLFATISGLFHAINSGGLW